MEPGPPALERGVLPTAPPGKSLPLLLSPEILRCSSIESLGGQSSDHPNVGPFSPHGLLALSTLMGQGSVPQPGWPSPSRRATPVVGRVSLLTPHSVLHMEVLPSFEMARQILLLKGRLLSPPQLYFSFIAHAQVYNT